MIQHKHTLTTLYYSRIKNKIWNPTITYYTVTKDHTAMHIILKTALFFGITHIILLIKSFIYVPSHLFLNVLMYVRPIH